MWSSFIGWPLLFVHFFLVRGEQLLAIQTILCATVTPYQPYHSATVVILFIHVTQHHYNDWVHLVLHHIIITAAVLLEYFLAKYHKVGWVCAAWSIYWLGSGPVHPIRACLRCLVFLLVSNARKKWTDISDNHLKTIWILLVHEVAWCAIPIQMLYEIYSPTQPSVCRV